MVMLLLPETRLPTLRMLLRCSCPPTVIITPFLRPSICLPAYVVLTACNDGLASVHQRYHAMKRRSHSLPWRPSGCKYFNALPFQTPPCWATCVLAALFSSSSSSSAAAVAPPFINSSSSCIDVHRPCCHRAASPYLLNMRTMLTSV